MKSFELRDFNSYLSEEKKVSDNTIEAYLRDIASFYDFIKSRGLEHISDVSDSEIVSYMVNLKKEGKSKSTLNRKLASLRTYFGFLVINGELKLNPAINVKAPRIERKKIEFLTVEEIDKLLKAPDESLKGIRDKAILELLYATGIRASELIEMELEDVNLRMGFVTCKGEHSKTRIIPMGRPARHAVEEYIYESRKIFLKEKDTKELFLNYMGEKMTRQGLWKVLKEYSNLLEFEIKLTPQVIRNSFAVHMLQNGADIKSLQELMGHEDINATQVYLSVTKNRIKDVYDKAHPRA